MRNLTLAIILVLAGCAEEARREWTPPPRRLVNPVVLDLEAVPEDIEVFPAGVIAGDPVPSFMMLWTQTTAASEVRLKVWIPDIDPQEPRMVDLLYDQPVTVAEAGVVHQFVGAVVPGRRHGYAFFTADARSRVGYFTAAPPGDALVRLTFSGTHGTHQKHAPYPALVKNAGFEPFTLYLHLGDSIYADDAESLEDFRAMWRENWQSEGFRAILADTVYLPVWDDHEVENDYSLESSDPVRVWRAQTAFYEFNPISRIPGAGFRLWRSWKWGRTVEFFALDCRGERLPSTREDLDAQYISPEQMAWLKDALLSSDAVFKLIINSAPIWDMPEIWMNTYDRWEGYFAQRQELIDFILESGMTDVYFVTGDFHMATVGSLDPPGGSGDILWEFIVGPGSQSNPLGDRLAIIEETGGVIDPLPPAQFLWGHPTATLSYVDLDPLADPPRMTLRYYDEAGAHLYTVSFVNGQPEKL